MLERRELPSPSSPPETPVRLSLPPTLSQLTDEMRVEIARDLVKILSDAKQVVPPQLQEMNSYGGGGGRGGGGGYRGGRGGGRGGGSRW